VIRVLALAFSLIFLMPLGFAQDDRTQELRQEEVEDYYSRWLSQDVVYIISDEERAVFQSLNTPEEKEQFIEQFWFRRDPDPRTSYNEFKEEHYRRIAYANEKFTSGDRGWMTDRGRVYIIHGPPDSMESRPMGGVYLRKIEEGGGNTVVHAYETWWYRHIDGMGDGVELEFVDPTGTGEFKLAVYDWEKDAGMMVGEGFTNAEMLGQATRADRQALSPGAGGAGAGPQNWYRRSSDTPFARYEKVARIGAAPITKYKDLKELVSVDVNYDVLPFEVKEEYFRLNETQALVPITIQVPNRELSFTDESGQQVARMGVYGIVSTMTNRVITEFEDDFVVRYSPDELAAGVLRSSVYQKIVPLDLNTRYKVELVLKDVAGGKTGVMRKALVPPKFDDDHLQGSSLILSDRIEALSEIPNDEQMFVVGDVRILPRMGGEFTNEMPLGIYYQIYNAGLDQATFEPSLKVTYRLLREGNVLAVAEDDAGESTQFFSGRRIVLMKNLSLDGLDPGKYQVEIEVQDQLTNETLRQVGNFTVVTS
jgi:GWxTD domain-containing protein